MLLPLVYCIVAAPLQDPGENLSVILKDPVNQEQTSVITQYQDRMDPPKHSPKRLGLGNAHLRFDWQTAVYGFFPPDDQGTRKRYLRFHVFSQQRNGDVDPAMKVARELARLWEYNFRVLGLDNSSTFNDGDVDVYLCDTGRPGGEQLFDYDSETPSAHGGVNTIYIYDMPTFNDPMEMAREVAHEYGHASLAPVGGYTSPEDWANGYLGEKLFLRHILREFDAKRYFPEDVMGVDAEKLRGWVHTNVDPLVIAAAERGPDLAALKDRSSTGMDAYIGLGLYVDTIFSDADFERTQLWLPGTQAKDYPDAIVTAFDEPPKKRALTIPDYLKGKKIWIPVGTSKLGGAEVVKRSTDWAQVVVGSNPITLTPQH
jgi:hypothetical protein